MKKLCSLLIGTMITVSTFAQKEAYKIFTKDGKETDYSSMLKTLESADIVLFGELHNNAVCHWMELEVARDLYQSKKQDLVLGAEMFEADDQIIIDEYLKGLILEKHLKAEAKVWPNYDTDYKPLLELAKDSNLRFIATNIPRRYANIVARKDLDALKELEKEARSYIAPLPIEVDMALDCYKMFVDMGMSHGEQTPEKMAKSQASKDATMAHFILQNWKKGQTFIHYNGAYHSDNFESIYWYLKKANSKLNIVTISTTEQQNIKVLDEETKGSADFIFVIPESFTKTY